MKKEVTRIGITFSPPTFKFEYTKGSSNNYHKTICMREYCKNCTDKECAMTAVEGPSETALIAESLMEKHVELRDVPETTCMIEKLFSGFMYTKANLEGSAGGQSINSTEVPELELNMPESKTKRDSCILRSNQVDDKDLAIISSIEKERLKNYGDLNRASEKELNTAKNDMETIFERHQILPCDDAYEYDKRREFEPDDESSWD